MNGDYHMLKPGGDFNYSAGADEILLLEYINSSPGTGMQLLIWSNVLFSISVSKTNQKQSAFSWQGKQLIFTVLTSGPSSSWPYVTTESGGSPSPFPSRGLHTAPLHR